MVSRRVPGWLLYSVWGVLLAFSLLYQTRRTYEEYFVPPAVKLGGLDTEHLTNIVRYAPANSALRIGDRLETVNGVRFRGFAQIQRAAYLAKPGDQLFLEVTRGGERLKLALPWLESKPPERSAMEWLVRVFSSVIMPWFSVLFGFWLLYRRPRDPMSWLFLMIMLGIGRFFGWAGFGWEDYFRQAAVFSNVFLDLMPTVGFLLLGMYFGGPWGQRWLMGLGWTLAVCLTALTTFRAVHRVWVSEASDTAGPVDSIMQATSLVDFSVYLAYGIFFYCLFGKYFTTQSPDLRRRLRILLVTMNICLLPTLLWILSRQFLYGGDASKIPHGWTLVTFVLMSLVPMSLAYVILVHRAVDVGVVVRTGLHYAMARGGVFFLQLVVAIAGIIWAVQFMENQHHLGAGVHASILAAYAALLFAIRWISVPVFGWIDRQFFRDAYSSEQVMAELTEHVRTVMNPQDLFHTLSERLCSALHVNETTFFLRNGATFEPAYATAGLGVSRFAEDSAPVRRLQAEQAPIQIFFDDAGCWCYDASVAPEDRDRLISLNTQVLLPLQAADRMVGFVSLGPKKSESPYTRNDLRLLKAVGAQAGLALENSRLAERLATEAASKERVHRELEIASEVQQRLFPQKPLTQDGVTIAGTCRPALAVGGDYYDYFRLENGSFGVAVGDVAGKGLGAALVMATLQASLRTQVLDGDPDLASLIARLNQVVYEASTRNRFATLFYAQFDAVSRELIYVNAGHNPPFVIRAATRTIERLTLTGIAVGLRRKQAFRQSSVRLDPGDVLIAFTDGISEAMNAQREEFGEERLSELLMRQTALDPDALIAAVLRGADDFAGGATQHDDMTLVVLRAS